MWNEICSKVFSECVETLENKKIEYFILRNYTDLPEKNSGKDVDIVVNPKKLALSKKIIRTIFKNNGFVYYDEAVFDSLHCMHGINLQSGHGIHIDLLAGYRAKGYEPMDFMLLYGKVIKYKNFYVLKEPVNSVMLLVSKIFGYKHPVIKEKYRQQIYNAYINDTNEFKETLRYILSGKAYEEVDKRLEENDFGGIIEYGEIISENIIKNSIKHHRIKSLKGALGFLLKSAKKIAICYRKYERSLAVVAPDGAGKTTFINVLSKKIENGYVSDENKIHVYHFRPGILPNLGEIGEKAGVMKQDKNWEDPHRRAPAGFFSSVFRIVYYSMDYIIGYKKMVRKDVHYDRFSVFDRYCYDLIADPERTRIKLPVCIRRFFVFLCPKPGLTFFLWGNENNVYGRKKELTVDEIRHQNSLYKGMAEKKKGFYILDADKDVEDIADEAIKIILEYYGEKLN